MKRLYFLLPLLLAAAGAHSFVEKFITDELDKEDVSAVNQNFQRISDEFDNTVHRTSTETIHGTKYFSDQITTTGGLGIQVSTAPRTSTTLGGTHTAPRLVYNSTFGYLCVSTSTNQNSYVIVTTITANVPCGS